MKMFSRFSWLVVCAAVLWARGGDIFAAEAGAKYLGKVRVEMELETVDGPVQAVWESSEKVPRGFWGLGLQSGRRYGIIHFVSKEGVGVDCIRRSVAEWIGVRLGGLTSMAFCG